MGKKYRFHVDIIVVHDEVTGSCIIVIVKFPNGETLRFVVDCGLFQEKKYDEYISEKLVAENSAKKLMRKMRDAVMDLSESPNLYMKIEKKDKLKREYIE